MGAVGLPNAAAHSLEMELLDFSGARAVRIVDGANSFVGEHAHEWPILSVYVMGDYKKLSSTGEARFASPSVVLHPAGEAHANVIGERGLEQIDIQFDPAWLRPARKIPFDRIHSWEGGLVAVAARRLASAWTARAVDEASLAQKTAQFLNFALATPQMPQPRWMDALLRKLEADAAPSTKDLASDLGMNPGWLAEAYRRARGEGIRETLRRRRVEQAADLLRGSDWPAAEIAAAAGFCDQSHMIRAFGELLGRTPSQVRAEWKSTSSGLDLVRSRCADGNGSKPGPA